jgi:predicted RNA-binding protein with RPS1 domain
VVKVRITGADRKRNRISLSLRELKVDESATLAEDMAANSDKQPQFKTSMELAFERAKPRKL